MRLLYMLLQPDLFAPPDACDSVLGGEAFVAPATFQRHWGRTVERAAAGLELLAHLAQQLVQLRDSGVAPLHLDERVLVVEHNQFGCEDSATALLPLGASHCCFTDRWSPHGLFLPSFVTACVTKTGQRQPRSHLRHHGSFGPVSSAKSRRRSSTSESRRVRRSRIVSACSTMTRCRAWASPGDIAGYVSAPFPGTDCVIVPAMSPAKGNTRASSAGSIS